MSNKRSSIFAQGKPENPYEDRDDEPSEPPRKATAAQMATRKIKSAKGARRPPGMTSGIPQIDGSPGFSFGGGDSTTSTANPFGSFGQSQGTENGGAFGVGAMSSFPPTQSSTSSNTFANSSFPAFGANNASTGFNPQPPSSNGFNFTAGASNPFGASAPAPTTNGSVNGGFSGSIFSMPGSSQPTNPFGSAAPTDASTTAPSGGLFGTTSAPQSNPFGSLAASTQNSASAMTAAPSNPFASIPIPSSSASTPFSFGSATQPTSAPQDTVATPQPTLFGSITPTAPSVSSAEPSTSTPFAGFGAQTQGESTSTPAAAPGLFQSGAASAQGESLSTPAATQGFSIFGASTRGGTTSTPAPEAPIFKGFGTSTPAAKIETTASTGSPFKGFGASTQAEPTITPLAASSPFKLNSAAENKEATSTPAGNIFGASTSKTNPFSGFGTTPQPNKTAAATQESASSSTTTPAKTAPFTFGTPQTTSKEPEKTMEGPETAAQKTPFGKGMFSSTSEVPKSSGLFGQSFAPTPLADNAFKPSTSLSKKPEATKSTSSNLFGQQSQTEAAKTSTSQNPPLSFGSFGQPKSSATSSDQSKDAAAQESSSSSSAFPPPKDLQPSASPSFFNRPLSPSKEPVPPSPASSMPTLTGAAAPPPEAPNAVETSKIPKIHVPKNWSAPKGTSADVSGLTIQLASVNEHYRAKLAQLPATADWTSLSQWHNKETSEIMKKITAIKKRVAAAKGITGNESSLSTKRKADDEVMRATQDASPSKKPRGGDAPSTPTPKTSIMFSTTPKATPPASQTSSLFGNILNKTSSASSGDAAVDKNTPGNGPEPAKSNDVTKITTSKAPFQFPGPGGSGSGSNGGSSGGFFGQFVSKAKSADELRAERKQKAKDNDFDSDEETEEEWSARYDREESERVANEKDKQEKEKASAPSTTNNVSSTSNLFLGVPQPTSGTSTPGLFSSRLGSPAPSNGAARSVFESPESGQTPTSGNIFGHLSDNTSSNDLEDDGPEYESDDEDPYRSQSQAGQPSDSDAKKRKHDQSESESEETLEEVMRRKKQDTRPTLLDRMTKDNSPAESNESEKEDKGVDQAISIFGQTNGVQTPARKPFFFDFETAISKSAPPKQDSFAGDQTFKPGTPIKFGTGTKENPNILVKSATPSPAEHTAAPAPMKQANPFAHLNAGQSGPASISPSVLSSRAPTPFSEAEASGKDSAAENEEDEGGKQDRLDISALTAEEKAENDILFHAEPVKAKHQVVNEEDKKVWQDFATGPLWILKNKNSGKAFVRMRNFSGATMLNYNILPKLPTTVAGKSKTMVSAAGQKKDGKISNIFFAVKTTGIAEEFSKVYNDNMPS